MRSPHGGHGRSGSGGPPHQGSGHTGRSGHGHGRVKRKRVLAHRHKKTTKNTHHKTRRTLSLLGDHSMANTGKFGRKRPYPEWVAPRLYVEDFLDFGALPAPMGLIDFHSHVHDY